MSKRLLNLLILTESVGFMLVLAFIWTDELLDMPHVFWGEPASAARFKECGMESVVVITAWILVLFITRKLVNRILELESYVVMCAWCRKIRIDGRWISIEEFLDKKIKIQTSHGMCEICREKVMDEINSLPPPK